MQSRIRKKLVLALLLTLFSSTWVDARSYVLNYSKPSEKWMGSMPLGNGRLGMMVYGGGQTETVALNEVTLWSGQEDPDANNLCGPENLKKMRQAFLDGDLAKGNELGNQY